MVVIRKIFTKKSIHLDVVLYGELVGYYYFLFMATKKNAKKWYKYIKYLKFLYCSIFY